MLQLFQSIFGSSREDAGYPEDLISRAIERAVDGTDPRIRLVPGYQKKLRAAVIHAIGHVIGLVDSLRAPVELSRANCATDPELVTHFASFVHAQEVLTLDADLNQWRASPDSTADRIVMLLLMEHHERQTFGVALQGDMLRRDVAQTTVSFAKHRFADPAASEDESRRLLKRRAFDHLLSLALNSIAGAHVERAELERERHLLRRKHTALANGRWGFDEASGGEAPNPKALQQQLEEIETQLKALGAGPDLLKVHIDMVADTLMQAEKNLWLDSSPLIVDRLGIKQTQASEMAPQIELAVLHNAAGRTLVARLVSVARSELPAQRDFLTEAQRYLR